MMPKRPQGAFQHFLKTKKGKKFPKGINPVSFWKIEFDQLSEKKKYQEIAIKDNERYQKEMEKFKEKVFDLPKRPFFDLNLVSLKLYFIFNFQRNYLLLNNYYLF